MLRNSQNHIHMLCSKKFSPCIFFNTLAFIVVPLEACLFLALNPALSTRVVTETNVAGSARHNVMGFYNWFSFTFLLLNCFTCSSIFLGCTRFFLFLFLH